MDNQKVRTLPLILLMIGLTISACGPQATAAPTTPPAAEISAGSDTPAPAAVSTATPDPKAAQQQYANSAFGLGFQFPSSWYGPDETISDQTLRVAVGSDVVYPYGESPEQPSPVKNSYLIVIQYSQNNQNSYWHDTYQTLAGLQDGESIPGDRGKIIRVRQLDLGRFKGFEYISTLSETAQTEPVYGREVLLVDDQSNLLTVFGTPNNVEVGGGTQWRQVYQKIDEANLPIFYEIIRSLTIEQGNP